MRIVDHTAATIRTDAERGGRWDSMQLWIVSDHGHSPVRAHDDLAVLFRSWGLRTIAHPWTFLGGRDAAVMVSGNAMAHIYLELDRRDRPWWPSLKTRWSAIVDRLLERPSVDLVILPHDARTFEVRHRTRGTAVVTLDRETISYRLDSGDPLGIGAHESLGEEAAYEATRTSDYPDALVQIARLASSPRSGEIILSASRDWDFRARYEPIPHVSSHGALHREHMLVPLLTNRPIDRTPRRTVDVMPSALVALGIGVPAGLDGISFIDANRPGHGGILTDPHLARDKPDDQRQAESAVA
jgi:hypothetical protein